MMKQCSFLWGPSLGTPFPSHCFSPEHYAHVEGNTYLFGISVHSTGSIALKREAAGLCVGIEGTRRGPSVGAGSGKILPKRRSHAVRWRNTKASH